MHRRDFIAGTAGFALAAPAFTGVDPATDPFALGVASGDPMSDSVVLWTRLVADRFDPASMGDRLVEVVWEMSECEDFATLSASGVVVARPEDAHSVHAEPFGLAPDRWYFYRFRALGRTSSVGRTRTSPRIGASLSRLTLALCSCQSYSQGFFSAYSDVAEAAPDLVIHVGDYIYTTPWTRPVRRMPAPDARTLDDFRAFHAAAKTDADLQRAHAAAPWLAIWDDHEVMNDYRGAAPPAGVEAAAYRALLQDAWKAYWEHMPLRRRARPQNGFAALHQRSVFGDLVQFDLLDTRQHRSAHPCPADGAEPGWIDCDVSSPARTMLGEAQERWLSAGYGAAGTRWNIIVQTTQFSRYERMFPDGPRVSSDRWTAYPAARDRLLDLVEARAAPNPVLFGGDIHAFFAAPVMRAGRMLASELVTAAISSGGGGDERHAAESAYYASQGAPFWFENRVNGHFLITIDPQAMSADARAVDTVLVPGAGARTVRRIEIADGAPVFAG